MKKAMTKKNNRGATLILVIVSLLFVGIIAAIVLTLTTSNVKNVFSSSKTTSNFYTAEKAVDEIRATLQEKADMAARQAYTQWLQRYSNLFSEGNTESVDTLFKNLFVDDLKTILQTVLYPTSGEGESLFTHLVDINDLLDTPRGDAVSWFDDPVVEIVDDKVVVKNISIQYKDDDGNVSVITTDIIFDITYPGFASNRVNYETLPCSTYAVIADEQITNSGTNPIELVGNIYGGGLEGTRYTGDGLYFTAGSNVSIKADYVLSRNAIKIEDNAKMKIAGPYATGVKSFSKIWARNIDLTATAAKGKPDMTITGSCYIADDLTLDAEGSKFAMTTGSSFYGYNTTNATAGATDEFGVVSRTGTPEGSSAIVINGKNSSIDLSGANNVWIAGKTFISVPSFSQANAEAGVGEAEIVATFIQGESLSYRALQAAYLMPGECVVGIGHNPMTYAEYSKVIDDSNTSCYVDTDKAREKGNVDVNLYVNGTNPYRVAFVKYLSGNTTDVMVYMYLNFISTNAASEYFSSYYAMNEDLVVSRMKQFGSVGQILINPLTLTNTGNVITYSDSGETYNLYDSHYDTTFVERQQISYSTVFKALTTSLDEKDLSMSTASYLTDSIVDMSLAGGAYTEYTGFLKDYEGNPTATALTALCQPEDGTGAGCKIGNIPCKLYTGDSVTINDNSAGIIVCAGDVAINADFYGLVVARGKVTVGGGAHIINSQTADIAGTTICGSPELASCSSVIKYIIQNEEEVKKLFRLATVKDDIDDIYTSDLITLEYSNWKKE